MRVIEPHSFKQKRETSANKKKRLVVLIFIAIGLVGSGFWIISSRQAKTDSQISSASTSGDEAIHKVAGVQNGPIKFFTGEQFQQLYEVLAMPNTSALAVAPTITGSELADKRIRQISESRGYKLRSVPVMPIIKTGEPGLTDDDLLQPKAYEGWLELKKSAETDRIPIKLNSGYRSIDWQRRYFVNQLQAAGVSTQQIINGQADSAIVSVLHIVAPPGYSRHHTGYTIDLVCDDGSGHSFENTACFNWISADNYAKAKQTGWIPSYPEGVSNQGPEPEPWEYVWVGTENLSN